MSSSFCLSHFMYILQHFSHKFLSHSRKIVFWVAFLNRVKAQSTGGINAVIIATDLKKKLQLCLTN
jgi:hypothetical protein